MRLNGLNSAYYYKQNQFYMSIGQKIVQRLERALVTLYMPPSLPPRGPGGWGLLAVGVVFVSVAAEKRMKKLFR